jgi:hypothetical protein
MKEIVKNRELLNFSINRSSNESFSGESMTTEIALSYGYREISMSDWTLGVTQPL